LALSAESPKTASRTEVVFDRPDDYTDWKLSDSADWYREAVFTALRSYLAKESEKMLPDGYTLKITITDIDLGNRASRKVPSASGAPAFMFNYVVTDASGAMVRQGAENLRFFTDFGNYRHSIETTDLTTDIIREEKPMLKSWAVAKLADLKQH
jgi:hypothetical protein